MDTNQQKEPPVFRREVVAAAERQFERFFGVQAVGRLGPLAEQMGMIRIVDD